MIKPRWGFPGFKKKIKRKKALIRSKSVSNFCIRRLVGFRCRRQLKTTPGPSLKKRRGALGVDDLSL
jgi:hypothetical protein